MEKFATLKTQAEEIKELEKQIIELATLHATICGANKTLAVVTQTLCPNTIISATSGSKYR